MRCIVTNSNFIIAIVCSFIAVFFHQSFAGLKETLLERIYSA